MSDSGGRKALPDSWTQWFRNFSNPSQAWMETIGVGAVACYDKKAIWQYPVFDFLVLFYAINEMTEALATMQGAQNPDKNKRRSFVVPFEYYRNEQLMRGILQAATSFILAEGSVEGLVKHFFISDLAFTLGSGLWSLPGRMCIHFMSKVSLDLYDFIKSCIEINEQDVNFNIWACRSILFNLMTNLLAVTAFGLLAYGHSLGFMFLGAFALARIIQNRHRPGLFCCPNHTNATNRKPRVVTVYGRKPANQSRDP